MAKNAKLDCFYCPKDKDVQIASHNFLKHTLAKHFDAFLCGTSKTAENNRKALKEASKFNPVELKFYAPTYYCCFKCNSASVKEASCRHHHFSTEDDAKNHKTEHLQGCKDLLKKVLARMEELKAAPTTPAPAEPTPTGDVKSGVKIVYKDRIVEKIVYVDKPIIQLSDERKDILTDILFEFNDNFKNEQLATKLVEKLTKDMIECNRLVKLKDAMIERLTNDWRSGATYDPQKLSEWSEHIAPRIKGDEAIVQKNIDTYKEFVQDNMSTEQQWEEHSDNLKKLGVYEYMMDLLL